VSLPIADDTARSPQASAWPAAGFAAVAFDLDGTLVNTLPAMEVAWNAVLAPAIGRAIPAEEIVATLGPHLIDIVRGYDLADAEAVTAALSEHYVSVFLTASQLYPGVADLVAELARRGCKLGVVTSMDKGARLLLEHFGLLEHFSVVVTEDDVVELKPAPEPVLKVAEALAVDPREILVVGDSHVDMGAARAAGAGRGAAVWGFPGRKAAADAQWIFERPADVLAVCP
jgi:2-phosphoglycolate phosphatase